MIQLGDDGVNSAGTAITSRACSAFRSLLSPICLCVLPLSRGDLKINERAFAGRARRLFNLRFAGGVALLAQRFGYRIDLILERDLHTLSEIGEAQAWNLGAGDERIGRIAQHDA